MINDCSTTIRRPQTPRMFNLDHRPFSFSFPATGDSEATNRASTLFTTLSADATGLRLHGHLTMLPTTRFYILGHTVGVPLLYFISLSRADFLRVASPHCWTLRGTHLTTTKGG